MSETTAEEIAAYQAYIEWCHATAESVAAILREQALQAHAFGYYVVLPRWKTYGRPIDTSKHWGSIELAANEYSMRDGEFFERSAADIATRILQREMKTVAMQAGPERVKL